MTSTRMAKDEPMKHSRGALLVLAVLLVLGVGFVVARAVRTSGEAPAAGGSAAPASAATPTPAELAELRQQLARLEARLRTREQGTAAPGLPPPAPEAPAAAGDPRTDPETRAEAQRRQREYVAGVDAEFRNEATDPRWSSATSSVIQAAIADDHDLRALVRGVECRSRTCRVEIADDGSGTSSKSVPMLAHQVGRDLPSVVFDRVENDRGGATVVLYLSRPDEAAAAP